VTDPETRPGSARFLRHLQPLSLEAATDDSVGRYGSLVLDFSEGEEIVVGVPMVQGREVHLDVGTAVTVVATLADGLRVFNATVLRRRELPSPCLYLSWPASVRRVQRRENARVEVLLPVSVRLGEGEVPKVLHGSTRDISAGGVQIALAEAPSLTTPVEIRLHIGDDHNVLCQGRVVRIEPNPKAVSERRYWVALEFVSLPQEIRKYLTRFIFDTQRAQLRRGVE
jgi:c-di-GMP-binding flagellar brake protein YcgR